MMTFQDGHLLVLLVAEAGRHAARDVRRHLRVADHAAHLQQRKASWASLQPAVTCVL